MSPTRSANHIARKNRYLGLTGAQIAALGVVCLIDLILIGVLLVILKVNLMELAGCYFFALIIPAFIGNLRITDFRGSLTRGVPVWREDLSDDLVQALRGVHWDLENIDGFIRVDGQIRLVNARHSFYRTSWPYVGYVDLSVSRPKIEYRTPLPGLLILIPHFVLFSPFVIAVLGLNHLIERGAIRNFISNNF